MTPITRTPASRRRTLVTGGAGFIGSALVWALNRRGAERIVIADLLGDDDKWRNLAALRFDDYLEATTLPAALARGLFDDVETVYHLGACSSTTEIDASYLIRNNYEFTRLLADWAVRRGVRFVYASSAATYGALEGDLYDEADIATLRPLNMYAYSKQLFDLYARRRGYLDRVVGLKYFNVFGPNEDHKGTMRSMVHKAFGQIRDSGRVQLFKSGRPEFGDGEQRRDFIYVKDAVEMTIHAAECVALNGLVNVGAGRSHTWNELARAVFAAVGAPVAIEYVEMPAALRGKYQYSTRAVIDRLRASGYDRAVTPFADAVHDYVTGYLSTGRRLGDEPRSAAW